jgi:hypothetical protein
MRLNHIHLTAVAVLAFLGGLAMSAQTGASDPSPDSMDAVTAAPKNHRVLYEDDHVRVLEVTVQPGETENMHIHTYASVFIYDAAQPRLRTTRSTGATREVGRNFAGVTERPDSASMPAAVRSALSLRESALPAALAMGWPAAMALGPDTNGPHQISNIDTFPHHFYRFEFKKLEGNDIMRKSQY